MGQAKELRSGEAALAVEDDVTVHVPIDEDGLNEAAAADVFREVVDAVETQGSAEHTGVGVDEFDGEVGDAVHFGSMKYEG